MNLIFYLNLLFIIFLLFKNGLTQQDPLSRAVRKIAAVPFSETRTISNFKDLSESHIVDTTYGPVKGFLSRTERDDMPYAGFVGIPYAEPPVGELRFKAPVPVKPWNEIRDAVEEGNYCHNMIDGNEDCLYINVFVPLGNPTNSLKAVMVFIHGGAFFFGSSDVQEYNPDFFLDKDVVFVSLNYRLGPLGFLSLQNEAVPGNAGLKDQLLGLKWVKDNILSFGGDPERIVIFGESAGSASVGYQQLCSSAQGLFSGVIYQSGTPLVPWGYVEPDLAVETAFHLGVLLGCDADIDDPNGKNLLLECLMSANASYMSSVQELALPLTELDDLRIFPFIPTHEPDLEGAFITNSPYDILSSGDFSHVPVIIGSNSREGLWILETVDMIDPFGWLSYYVGTDMTRFVPYQLNVTANSTVAPEIELMIKNFYFDRGSITLEQRLHLMDAVTDTQFHIGIQTFTSKLAELSTAPVWNYQLTYDGPFNMKANSKIANVPGVSHADEFGYLTNPASIHWRYAEYPDRDSTPQLTIDRMVEMWTNFAKYQSPTPDLNGYVKTNWKPFTSSEHNYLDIGAELVVKQGLAKSSMKFWNDIFEIVTDTRPLPE